MMTAEEYRKIMLRKNLLIILFLCLCIIGVSGAIIYYNRLAANRKELKVAEVELQRKNDSLQRATTELQSANQSLQELKDTLAKQKANYADILISKNPAVIKQAAKTLQVSRDSARIYAREGYRKLKAKDFKGAMDAFDKSEKFVNGYRDSYDVYFLLWKNRSNLNDPKVQKQIMQQVLTKYNSLRILSRTDLQ
jgi:hypothetical protein